jgi:hypothetical protein
MSKIEISDTYMHAAYVELRDMEDAGTLTNALYVLMRRVEDAIDDATVPAAIAGAPCP